MKKSLLVKILIMIMSVFAVLGVTACQEEHAHTYSSVVTAPTCTEQGFTTHSCVCGDSYVDTYVDKLGHSFTNYVSDNNATCGIDGTKTAKCDNNCGEKDTVIDVDSSLGLGHNYNYNRVITEPTCTQKGYTTYSCSCGDSYIGNYVNEKDHTYTTYVYNNDAKCEVDGTETAKCDYNCGKEDTRTKVGSALTHSFTSYVYNNDAKCEVNGTETAKCDHDCGKEDTRSKVGTALTHLFTNYVSDKNATYDSDGTKTAKCDHNCGKVDTVIDVGSKLTGGIAFNTLEVNGGDVYGKVANRIEEFSFITEITILSNSNNSEHISYIVSLNKYGTQTVITKIVPLEVGDNEFYVFETRNNQLYKTYKVIIRRRPTYEVTFVGDGGVEIETQTVEEDSFAISPQTTPTKTGYTFTGWNYNLTNAIIKNETVTASWSANTATPYKVEYYLENLDNEEYTLHKTENKTGTTDTEVYAEIKEFTHFTPELSEVKGNVNADGSQVLKVYYQRNEYTVTFNGNGGTLVSGNEVQSVKYQGSATAPTYIVNEDYIFDKFDVDFTNVDRNLNVKALWNIAIFNYSNSTITGLTKTGKTLTSITIPNTINGITITSIGSYAFRDCTSLTSITIPNSVTSIGGMAFSDCDSLTSIEIPSSVTSISSGAFDSCDVLTIYCQATSKPNGWENYWYSGCPVVWNSNDNSVADDGYIYKTVNGLKYGIKDGVATVVRQPINITSVNIQPVIIDEDIAYSVISISPNAFYNCSLLTNVIIPNNVTSIGYSAFEGCPLLTSITIPKTVKNLGSFAFYNCRSLTIYCEATSKPSGYDSYWYSGCPVVWNCNNNDVAIDGYIYAVIDGIRYGIKDGVATVVRQSSNITSANIQSTVTYKGVTYNVTSIEVSAFENCSSLTSIQLPNSVTSIGGGAFYNCTSLTSIEIPNSVTSMGDYAFYNCTSLVSVTIGNGVTIIGDEAFYNCTSLVSVTIGNGVTIIGDEAFYYCKSLTNITIPNSVTSIGEDAFASCFSLEKVYYTGTIDEWVQIEFGNYSSNPLYYPKELYINNQLVTEANITTATKISNYAFYTYDKLASVTIGSGVTSIGNSAFYGCSKLISIEIPNSVTSIGNRAFQYCKSLASIEIPNSVTSIGSSAFQDCTSLVSVTIGNGVTNIGSSAFSRCTSLTSITIPNSVTSIGDYAFSGCSNLQYNIKNGLKYLGNSQNPYLYLADTVSESITTATIESDCRFIGSSAFGGCTSLTSIELPNSVTSIGNSAFSNCTSLTSIELPNSVTSMGDYAFSNCTSLTSIEIPNSVTNIGEGAFSGCSAEIKWGDNPAITSIGSYAFSGYNGTSITIPNSVTSISDYAFSWCTSLTSIEIPNSVTSIGNYAFEDCTSLIIYCEATSKPSGWYNAWNYSNCPVVWNCNNNDVATDGYIYTSIDGIRYSLKDGVATVIRQPINIASANIQSTVTYKGVTYNVTSIEVSAFENCSSLTSIEIPNSVTSIGEDAFYNCSSLTSVTIGNGVTSIGRYAFYNCSSLTSIEIPNSVTSIGDCAFEDCTSLTNVTIGNSVTSIGNYAFSDCTSLASITIPNSVTSIGYSAFFGCRSLTIYCEATSKPSGWHSDWNYSNCPVYWYSENKPTTSGNYWHYVDGVVTKW